MSEQKAPYGNQQKYQRVTSYHNGAIRVTVDQDGAVISKLSGDHPVATVITNTRQQMLEVVSYLQEGLVAAGISDPDATEQQEAVATLQSLLNSLETLRSMDLREAATIPGPAEKWERAMEQGQYAIAKLREMLDEWEEELGDMQYETNEYLDEEDEEDDEEDFDDEEDEEESE